MTTSNPKPLETGKTAYRGKVHYFLAGSKLPICGSKSRWGYRRIQGVTVTCKKCQNLFSKSLADQPVTSAAVADTLRASSEK